MPLHPEDASPRGGQSGRGAPTYVLPLLHGDAVHGIVVLQECARPLDTLVEREVIAVATTMSLALHALALRDRLSTAIPPEQVEEALTRERRRIAREIHDGPAQNLAYLLLKTELLDRLVERDPAAAREQAAALRQLLQQTADELRRCTDELRRPSADQGPALTGPLRPAGGNPGELPERVEARTPVPSSRPDAR